MKAIEKRLAKGDVKLLVLVDYPGFHLRLAAVARRLGVPVFYYIAPQLWAWHESRVRKMAATVSRLGVILPFEEAFFGARGVPATYVGHPLLDRPPAGERDAVQAALGLAPDRKVLGLFPGSRPQEVVRLWPLMRDAARLVRRRRPDVQVLVAAARGATYPGAEGVQVVPDRPHECFAAADAALCKSGTTTLEAALAGAPQVIAYRMNGLSYRLAKRLVRVSWIGLVNLVAGRQVAPEFVQDAATPDTLATAVMPLLEDASPERRQQLEGIRDVRQKLGGPGAARRAAELASELVAA
jgi:lipid-A-disaccharide synthase